MCGWVPVKKHGFKVDLVSNWNIVNKCWLLTNLLTAMIYYPDVPVYVLICGTVVHMDEVEKSEGPKLLYDAISEWPNYMRLLLPILYIAIEKKTESSPVQWLHTT